MKIVNFGDSYQIYPDNLKTFDQLPAQTYKIKFSEMSGYSLEKVNDLSVKESKIYGTHAAKVDKVMRTYEQTTRSLGVILSGDKGIGKTMSLQLLSERMINGGKPVIIIDHSYPGLANFIDSIEQDALVIFDEFEKVFQNRDAGDSNSDKETQTSLLSLFDGTSSTKRLYAITVNDLRFTSSYLLNRPGRFHYHFRYDYPTYDEVMEYMNDNCKRVVPVEEKTKAANFSMKVPLNFDMLRAIVQELNFGETFASAIQDLNIMSEETPNYIVTIALKSGQILRTHLHVDLFSQRALAELDQHNEMDHHQMGGEFVIDTTQIIGNKDRFDVPLSALSQLNISAYIDKEAVSITPTMIRSMTIQLDNGVNDRKYTL